MNFNQEQFGQTPEQSETNQQRKKRRFRFVFTTDQILHLENLFKQSPYVSPEQRKEIALALNLPDKVVKIWFQNRRMKEKKDLTQTETDEIQDTFFNPSNIQICPDPNTRNTVLNFKVPSVSGKDDFNNITPLPMTLNELLRPQITIELVKKMDSSEGVAHSTAENRFNVIPMEQTIIDPHNTNDVPEDLSIKRIDLPAQEDSSASINNSLSKNVTQNNQVSKIIRNPVQLPIVTSPPDSVVSLSRGSTPSMKIGQAKVKKKCDCSYCQNISVQPSTAQQNLQPPQEPNVTTPIPLQNTFSEMNLKKK